LEFGDGGGAWAPSSLLQNTRGGGDGHAPGW
jgi:hypothetical protein